MHYHYTPFGKYKHQWQYATAMYEQIMQERQKINYVTVVRSPRAHFLSFYYFYIKPKFQVGPAVETCHVWAGGGVRCVSSLTIP